MTRGESYFEGLVLEHDCRICKRSSRAREAWGCEESTRSPQLYIPCQSCGGGRARGCGTCDDSGFEAISRCPYSFVPDDVWEFVYLHVHWPGSLPDAGGIYDQPAGYVTSMRILDAAKAQLEKEIESRQKKRGKTRAS